MTESFPESPFTSVSFGHCHKTNEADNLWKNKVLFISHCWKLKGMTMHYFTSDEEAVVFAS